MSEHFSRTAQQGSPEEAVATFYAYESQVPRVAQEKARGLRELYGADEKTYAYFTLHTTADVYHSGVWRQQLAKLLEKNPDEAGNIDLDVLNEWQQTVLDVSLEQFSTDDVYNADEFALFWQLLPNKTLTFKGVFYYLCFKGGG